MKIKKWTQARRSSFLIKEGEEYQFFFFFFSMKEYLLQNIHNCDI